MSFLMPPSFAARIRPGSGRPSSPPARRRRRQARPGAGAGGGAPGGRTTSLTVPSTRRPVTSASLFWVGKVVWSWPATKAAATPAPRPRISTAVRKIGRFGEAGHGRHARRLDHLHVERAGPALDVAAQPHLFAIGEQLVILLLEHVIIAGQPGLVGGEAGLGRLARAQLAEVRGELVAARGGGGERGLALAHHRAQRDVARIGHAAGIAAARLGGGEGAQPRDLLAQRRRRPDAIRSSPGEVAVELALERRDLAGGGAAIVAGDAGDGRRRRRELSAHRGERAVGGGDLLLEIGELGLRGRTSGRRSCRCRGGGP